MVSPHGILMRMLLFLLGIFCVLPRSFAQVQWQRCLGGTDAEDVYSVQQTTDGGYIISGYSRSIDGDMTLNKGYEDNWVVKLSASGAVEWQRSYGGSSDDYGGPISQTTDGGYIMACSSFSNDGDVSGNHGQKDGWIAKLSASGGVEWQKCIGGSSMDKINSIQQTTDGGYIMAGTTKSNDGDVSGNHGDYDYWVVKLSSVGIIQWQKCYGGSDYDEANSIAQTSDGGYIVAGATNSTNGDVSGNHGFLSDYWIIKLSSSGGLDWQKCLGGNFDDEAHSVVQTFDGGYIIAGVSRSINGDIIGNHGEGDHWIVKLSSVGSLQWQRALGSSGDEGANSVKQTADGGYVVAGSADTSNGDVTGSIGRSDIWIVKLSGSGNIAWQKCFGSSHADGASAIQQTTDGGYILAGVTVGNDGDVAGYHGGSDIWVVKLGAKTAVDGLDRTIVTIAPNPATDALTINGTDRPVSVICDVAGHMVSRTTGTNTISLAGLASGIYFIMLFDETGAPFFRDKFIKN